MNQQPDSPKIKAVIFDWGGVISPGGSPDEASVNLAELLQVPLAEAKRLFRVAADDLKRGKISEETFWSLLVDEHGTTVSSEQRKIWIGWDALAPSAAMKDHIEDLKKRGYKVAVLSNTFPQAVDTIRSHGGYKGFDAVILSSDEGHAKPDPEIYQLVLDRLELKGEECIFVDDQQKCLDPAVTLFGMQIVLAVSPDQTVESVNNLLSH